MTKHTDSSRSTDSGVSTNARTSASESREDIARASAWLQEHYIEWGEIWKRKSDLMTVGAGQVLAAYADSECSRLASRNEQLEKEANSYAEVISYISEIVNGTPECHYLVIAGDVQQMRDRLAGRVEELELELRMEWWGNHGCAPSARYGDDGELQCNERGCLIHDFKRTPFDKLRDLIFPARVRGLDRKQNGAGAHAEEKK